MRILIAEDDTVSAKVLNHIVSPYGECVVARNGFDAYDYYCSAAEEGKPFDLVFLDIMMPEASGQETLEAIRQYEQDQNLSAEKSVKVIMVTALDDGQNLYEAHSQNCLDYIVKPIQKERVIQSLRKHGIIDTNKEDTDNL